MQNLTFDPNNFSARRAHTMNKIETLSKYFEENEAKRIVLGIEFPDRERVLCKLDTLHDRLKRIIRKWQEAEDMAWIESLDYK